MSSAAKYAVLFISLALIVIAGQFVVHAVRTEPRDSRRVAARELAVNVIPPDEHIVDTVSVYRRAPHDYFRATRGLLAMTDKRLVFIGVRPRDLTSTADAPPTFDEQDFPFDTLAAVTTGRAMSGLSKGIVIHTANETLRLAVPSQEWPAAERLVAAMANRRRGAQAAGATQESLRKMADVEWSRAVAAWKAAQFYMVRRGDALGNVATRWNTTPEQLQRLNHLAGFNIRVGDSLLVRSAM